MINHSIYSYTHAVFNFISNFTVYKHTCTYIQNFTYKRLNEKKIFYPSNNNLTIRKQYVLHYKFVIGMLKNRNFVNSTL